MNGITPEREGRSHAARTTWSNQDAWAGSGRRSVRRAMLRGLNEACPACGAKTLYSSYLRVQDACPACGEELMHHRADDAPPYFTIMITGHVIVSLLIMVELAFAPPVWLHLLIWLPLTAILSLVLLPRVKGAIVGLQWAQRMHGFGEGS